MMNIMIRLNDEDQVVDDDDHDDGDDEHNDDDDGDNKNSDDDEEQKCKGYISFYIILNQVNQFNITKITTHTESMYDIFIYLLIYLIKIKHAWIL